METHAKFDVTALMLCQNHSMIELGRSMKALYDHREYADWTLVSASGTEHRIHSFLLWPRSEFFARNGRYNVSIWQPRSIDVLETDKDVQRIVSHCYWQDYSQIPHLPKPAYWDNVYLYDAGVKYDLQSLKIEAKDKFCACLGPPQEQTLSSIRDFIEIVDCVYSLPLNAERDLYDVVISHAKDIGPDLLALEDFEEVIAARPKWAIYMISCGCLQAS